MSNRRLFFLSLLITMSVMLAYFYATRRDESRASSPKLTRIADDLFVTSQLRPGHMRFLRNRGIKTIVDMRPDGEAADQTPSSEIGRVSKDYAIEFHYIPVPHESIPDSAVTALNDVLSQREAPAVLYCRTGRRAVRLFALVEASRADGPDTNAILKMARAAGFSADDLQDDIARRVSDRKSTPEVKN